MIAFRMDININKSNSIIPPLELSIFSIVASDAVATKIK